MRDEARLTLAGLHDEGKAGRNVLRTLSLGHCDGVWGGDRQERVLKMRLSELKTQTGISDGENSSNVGSPPGPFGGLRDRGGP